MAQHTVAIEKVTFRKGFTEPSLKTYQKDLIEQSLIEIL